MDTTETLSMEQLPKAFSKAMVKNLAERFEHQVPHLEQKDLQIPSVDSMGIYLVYY